MSWSGPKHSSHAKSNSKPHKSHHDHDGKSSKSDGRSSKTQQSSRASSSTQGGQTSVRFLFVVNEANMLENARNVDQYGNEMPPLRYDGFDIEDVGTVFQYHNGVVTVAEGWYWIRNGPGQIGRITRDQYATDQDGNTTTTYAVAPQYSTRTVYHCGPFLPCVYAPCDASANIGAFDRWHALHFHHEHGVSRALANGGNRYIAGKHADWMEKHPIISQLYKNPYPGIPRSAGLGGDFAIIIGLMALSQPRGTIDRAFQQRLWHMGTWTGAHPDSAWPLTAHETPRGVIVHIAIEHEGPLGWTEDDVERLDEDLIRKKKDLKMMEWYGVTIAG